MHTLETCLRRSRTIELRYSDGKTWVIIANTWMASGSTIEEALKAAVALIERGIE